MLNNLEESFSCLCLSFLLWGSMFVAPIMGNLRIWYVHTKTLLEVELVQKLLTKCWPMCLSPHFAGADSRILALGAFLRVLS
jgi:hypothetical protein